MSLCIFQISRSYTMIEIGMGMEPAYMSVTQYADKLGLILNEIEATCIEINKLFFEIFEIENQMRLIYHALCL